MEYDTSFLGNDLSTDPNPEQRDTLEECQSLCQLRVGCEFFTYDSLSKQCSLKTSDVGRVSASAIISGTKFCYIGMYNIKYKIPNFQIFEYTLLDFCNHQYRIINTRF